MRIIDAWEENKALRRALATISIQDHLPGVYTCNHDQIDMMLISLFRSAHGCIEWITMERNGIKWRINPDIGMGNINLAIGLVMDELRKEVPRD